MNVGVTDSESVHLLFFRFYTVCNTYNIISIIYKIGDDYFDESH